MSAAQPQSTSPMDARLAVLRQIEQLLLERRDRIDAEVADYPRPITACDVQFEHALDQQARIRAELRRALALAELDPARDDFLSAIEALVVNSVFLTDDGKQRIRSSLAELTRTDTC